jgi:Ran GTPase-activating protein (RanGAP) involved in mRNA processing and transport
MARGGSRCFERKDEALDERALLEVLRQVDADRCITTLRLVNTGLSPSLAVQLADFLENNATLTHVDLSGNDRMGAHGVSCLAESLTKNTTLRALILSRCKLSSNALNSWATFFRKGVNTTLQTIE